MDHQELQVHRGKELLSRTVFDCQAPDGSNSFNFTHSVRDTMCLGPSAGIANSCYEHGLSTAKDVLNHGPTRTHRSHGHMWLNPDQEDVPRPGVMAWWHHSFPFLHRSAVRFSFFFNQITKKTSTGPCGDSPSLLPGNPPQGDDSWRSDGLGAVHQEYWPIAIHPHW